MKPIIDLENQSHSIYKYINLFELFDMFISLYYNETFLISKPFSYGQIIPHTFTFKLEDIQSNFLINLNSINYPLFSVSYLNPIYTLLTHSKEYKSEWYLSQFSKLDKFIYNTELLQSKIDYSMTIRLINNEIPFKSNPYVSNDEIVDDRYPQIQNIFNSLDHSLTVDYYKRINCNLLSNFEIPQENIILNYKIETYLNRKRFRNIDDFSNLTIFDGRYIMNVSFHVPEYNIFDMGIITDDQEQIKYISTNSDVSPLVEKGLFTYQYRQNIDKIFSSEFIIDGNVFDLWNKLDFFRKDKCLKLFYIFHKFNSLGYPQFITICEITIENDFMYNDDNITFCETILDDIYIKLLGYDFKYPLSQLKKELIDDQNITISIEEFLIPEKFMFNSTVYPIDVGDSKIQIRNWNQVFLKTFNNQILQHGHSVYKNLVISSYVWGKSQQSSQIGNTIFKRDVIKDFNPTYQYRQYDSFYSWNG